MEETHNREAELTDLIRKINEKDYIIQSLNEEKEKWSSYRMSEEDLARR